MTSKQAQNLLQYLDFYKGIPDGEWGPMSQQACREFQNRFGGITVDGFVGPETEKALKHAVSFGYLGKEETHTESETADPGDFWDEIEFFDPEEFKCKCGGKYCDGYPHTIQPLIVRICDRARRWSGHPITVVSGLRCETHNRNEKGVANSQHKYGEAADLYFSGVGPNAALAWLQSQPDVRYAYRIEGSNNIHFDIQPVGR